MTAADIATHDADCRAELARRIGYAKGQIREALRFAEEQETRNIRGAYSIKRPLNRALRMLDTGEM